MSILNIMKRILHSRLVIAGHLEGKLPEEEIETETIMCEHKDYCTLQKSSVKCIGKKEDCKAYQFYNKYGEVGNYFGI
jgi:hypothetical protein